MDPSGALEAEGAGNQYFCRLFRPLIGPEMRAVRTAPSTPSDDPAVQSVQELLRRASRRSVELQARI
jgi:hypothetical protein